MLVFAIAFSGACGIVPVNEDEAWKDDTAATAQQEETAEPLTTLPKPEEKDTTAQQIKVQETVSAEKAEELRQFEVYDKPVFIGAAKSGWIYFDYADVYLSQLLDFQQYTEYYKIDNDFFVDIKAQDFMSVPRTLTVYLDFESNSITDLQFTIEDLMIIHTGIEDSIDVDNYSDAKTLYVKSQPEDLSIWELRKLKGLESITIDGGAYDDVFYLSHLSGLKSLRLRFIARG